MPAALASRSFRSPLNASEQPSTATTARAAPAVTTGLIVPVAGAADRLVRECARRFEPTSPTAALGPELVAAHVTVLWPFLAPQLIDQAIVDELRSLCGRHPRHDLQLQRVATFDTGA